jgi:hypothetical protein
VAFLGYLVQVNAQLGGQFGISYLQFFWLQMNSKCEVISNISIVKFLIIHVAIDFCENDF